MGNRVRRIAVLLGLINLVATASPAWAANPGPWVPLKGGYVRSTGVPPWRTWMPTLDASHLRNGIGMVYGSPDGNADHTVGYLAAHGVKALRYDLSFGSLAWQGVASTTDALDPTAAAQLDAFLAACKRYGIRPMVLLDGHAAHPGPMLSVQRSLVVPATAGTNVLSLSDVSGLTVGHSGLDEQDWAASRLITSIATQADGSGTVTLSRPLDTTLTGTVTLSTLRYLPLAQPGSADYADSLGGWLRFVALASAHVQAAGITAWDAEIWNELLIGSQWLSADFYSGVQTGDLTTWSPEVRRGGTGWELASETASLLHRVAPGASPIWGFSNLDVDGLLSQLPAAKQLPHNIAGESFHPYGTAAQSEGGNCHSTSSYTVSEPEGITAEGWSSGNLVSTQLAPDARSKGTRVITEHGVDGAWLGVTDPAVVSRAKALTMTRAMLFWLHAGIDRFYPFTAWYDGDPLEFGLMDPTDPYGTESPAMTALSTISSTFALRPGEKSPSRVRPLTVTRLRSLGRSPVLAPADCSAPVRAIDRVDVQPWQVSTKRYVVVAYVQTFDQLSQLAPQTYDLRLDGLAKQAGRGKVTATDLVTGAKRAASAVRSGSQITVTVPLDGDPVALTFG